MKILKYNFASGIDLFNFGDVHWGDEACDRPLAAKTVDYVARHENAYWVSIGDLLNVALKNSLSGPYHSMNVDQELATLKPVLAPIFNKCLGLVSSNHHDRMIRETGLSLDALLAREWGLPFLGPMGVVAVACGSAVYYVALHHGLGAGRTDGGKINNTKYLASVIPACDLYLSGHTHSFSHTPDIGYVVDRKLTSLVEIQQHFVVTGHYLDYETSYAPSKLYKPKPKGASVTTLYPLVNGGKRTERRIAVDLFN